MCDCIMHVCSHPHDVADLFVFQVCSSRAISCSRPDAPLRGDAVVVSSAWAICNDGFAGLRQFSTALETVPFLGEPLQLLGTEKQWWDRVVPVCSCGWASETARVEHKYIDERPEIQAAKNPSRCLWPASDPEHTKKARRARAARRSHCLIR